MAIFVPWWRHELYRLEPARDAMQARRELKDDLIESINRLSDRIDEALQKRH